MSGSVAAAPAAPLRLDALPRDAEGVRLRGTRAPWLETSRDPAFAGTVRWMRWMRWFEAMPASISGLAHSHARAPGFLARSWAPFPVPVGCIAGAFRSVRVVCGFGFATVCVTNLLRNRHALVHSDVPDFDPVERCVLRQARGASIVLPLLSGLVYCRLAFSLPWCGGRSAGELGRPSTAIAAAT